MNFSQLPPPLQPGDLLRVIAPCGALREFEAFNQGVQIWRDRWYCIEISPVIDKRWGYLAGTDQLRRQEMAEAWIDPKVKAILCARGGYGSARLLEDWSMWHGETKLSRVCHPKWLIGFSDATGLLWSLFGAGISGIHGPLITTIAQEPDWSIVRLFDWLEGRPLQPLSGIGWGKGAVSGILLPANLTVATHLLATPMQPAWDNIIVALEDVTEAPYRIDRMLTQWRLCGAFNKVRGIALGRFSRCEPMAGIPSFTVEEVLRDRLADLNIPIVSDLPFGHDGANAALPVGMMAHLDGDNGILAIESPG
jgi:muramoyltetrapeptide carboxypeptidase